MFPFDLSALPRLTTRRALLAVDFQNDFVGADAALPVCEPEGFVSRAVALAEALRAAGDDVVWVQSRFEQPRPPDEAPILAADRPPTSQHQLHQQHLQHPHSNHHRHHRHSHHRGGGRPSARESTARSAVARPPEDAPPPPDPEAFLSHDEPACVKPASPGAAMAPAIQRAVLKGDTVLFKSHYSAFQGTHLLRLLRAKMVMEVFICGSLTNVGVYATALDAAGHGMAITIVEDCCGYRSDARRFKAVRSLVKLTGCEVASCEKVLESLQPKQQKQQQKKNGKAKGGKEEEEETEEKKEEEEESEEETDEEEFNQVEKNETNETTKKGEVADNYEPVKKEDEVVKKEDEIFFKENGVVKKEDEVVKKKDEEDKVETAEKEEASDDDEEKEERGETDQDEAEEEDESDQEREDEDGAEAETQDKPALAAAAPSESDKSTTGTRASGSPDIVKAMTGLRLTSNSPGPDTADADPHVARPQFRGSAAGASGDDQPAAPLRMATATPPAASDDDADADADAARPQKGLCEGDMDIIDNALPPSLERGIVDRLRDEVQWQGMSHQGGQVPRLVAVQGAVSPDDDSVPVYRHPSDEAPRLRPFSPTVLAVKAVAERHLGHPLNHVLIQLYRDGADFISEHSDKTLDIAADSYIANVSLGAERTMVLRTKRADADDDDDDAAGGPGRRRRVQRARLHHNSLCRMGLRTNMKWLHAIRPDRRADRDKTPAELAYGGARISLTFRRIATFLTPDEALIWGQGATGKTRAQARPVVNGQGPEAVALLRAFGRENHAPVFDWHAHYGSGFDVLHLRAAPRFFASSDAVVNMRVALMLAELGVGYARGSVASSPADDDCDAAAVVRFVDCDAARSTVRGDVAIMLYLDACYGPSDPAPLQPALAVRLTRFQRALHLLDIFRRHSPTTTTLPAPLKQELSAWDAMAGCAPFLAGPLPSLPDFALWPVLHAVAEACAPSSAFDGLHNLQRYYDAFAARPSARKLLGEAGGADAKTARD